MNIEQDRRIINYLRWKLNHNRSEINATNLARYLNISVSEAEEKLEDLYQKA